MKNIIKYYSQMGLSLGFKFLILLDKGDSKSDNLRLFGHLAYILLSPKSSYYSFDIGIGLQYIYNEKLSFYLDRRMMLNHLSIGGTTEDYVPNLLILNVCYKFNLVL